MKKKKQIKWYSIDSSLTTSDFPTFLCLILCTLVQNIAFGSGPEAVPKNFFSLWQTQVLTSGKTGEILTLRTEPLSSQQDLFSKSSYRKFEYCFAFKSTGLFHYFVKILIKIQ